MTKVILRGRRGCSYDLGVGFVPAAQVIDLSRDELEAAEKSNLIEEYIDKKPEQEVSKKKKYTKEGLEELSFTELKKIGTKFGVTDRSKTKLIKEIIEAQK